MKRLLNFQADRIELVLASHKVPARVTGGTVTPRFVRFQVMTPLGVKVRQVAGLAEELALSLNAPNCRVYRQEGQVQVEVPSAPGPRRRPARPLPQPRRPAPSGRAARHRRSGPRRGGRSPPPPPAPALTSPTSSSPAPPARARPPWPAPWSPPWPCSTPSAPSSWSSSTPRAAASAPSPACPTSWRPVVTEVDDAVGMLAPPRRRDGAPRRSGPHRAPPGGRHGRAGRPAPRRRQGDGTRC